MTEGNEAGVLDGLAAERQRLRDAIHRCDDLGMKMLLMGKLKAAYRAEEAARTQPPLSDEGMQ